MARHLAEPIVSKRPLYSPLSSMRGSKAISWPITGASALGLIVGLALPAHAEPLSDQDTLTTGSMKLRADDAQTLTVSKDVAEQSVTRDAFGATSQAELDARKRAEEEKKAAKAQEEALKRIREARAAVGTSNAFDKTETPISSHDFVEDPPAATYSGQAVVDYAEQFVGVIPYTSGATPQDGFMCDGLVQYTFGQFGVKLPRGVDHQAAMGIPIAPEDARAGDVVVWPGQHIGIYDGNGGVIHSPNWGRKVTHANQLWGSYKFYRFVD